MFQLGLGHDCRCESDNIAYYIRLKLSLAWGREQTRRAPWPDSTHPEQNERPFLVSRIVPCKFMMAFWSLA
jgi:hypothetical protein